MCGRIDGRAMLRTERTTVLRSARLFIIRLGLRCRNMKINYSFAHATGSIIRKLSIRVDSHNGKMNEKKERMKPTTVARNRRCWNIKWRISLIHWFTRWYDNTLVSLRVHDTRKVHVYLACDLYSSITAVKCGGAMKCTAKCSYVRHCDSIRFFEASWSTPSLMGSMTSFDAQSTSMWIVKCVTEFGSVKTRIRSINARYCSLLGNLSDQHPFHT